MAQRMFFSDIKFIDRRTKAAYVYEKYQSILKGSVLDVGADAMHLKPAVEEGGGAYTGVGFGDYIDLEFDLEKVPLPFESESFNTVLCLDVLEHLENIHSVFDELCRLSRNYIIISLPNPWADFLTALRKGDYSESEKIKFYGLPIQRPEDRHRWFFREDEAVRFIKKRAEANSWRVAQFDATGEGRALGGNGLKGLIGRQVLKVLFRKDIDKLGLNHSTLWFVLERKKRN